MKTTLIQLLSLILFLCNLNISNAQNLTLNQILYIINLDDVKNINNYLSDKDWEYYNSEKGDNDEYDIITWSYEKNYYDDKAQGWFYGYFYDNIVHKISYMFFEKSNYDNIIKSISGKGFRELDSEIGDGFITTKYANSKLSIYSSISQGERNDYSDSKMARYSIYIEKVGGYFDTENGAKIINYESGEKKAEYNLKDGKIDGIVKVYFKSGQIYSTAVYKNGIKNGKTIIFQENGKIESEEIYLDSNLHGFCKYYHENGKLRYTGNYYNNKAEGLFTYYSYTGNIRKEIPFINDKKSGIIKEYDSISGSIVSLTEYKDDLLNGSFVYYYPTGQIYCSGNHKQDEKHGFWGFYSYNEGVKDTITYQTYDNGILDGKCMQNFGDTLIEIAYYKNGILDGKYIAYEWMDFYYGETLEASGDWVKDAEGYYVLGEKNGFWKEYLMGSLTSAGKYENGVKSGQWVIFGFIHKKDTASIVNYKNGILNGKKIKYLDLDFVPDKTDTNSLNFVETPTLEIFYYKNGKLDGNYLLRDSLGNKTIEGYYSNDNKTGRWKYYNSDQKLYMDIIYLSGIPSSQTFFDNTENKLFTKNFTAGVISSYQLFNSDILYETHKIVNRNNARFVIEVKHGANYDTNQYLTYSVNCGEDYEPYMIDNCGILNGASLKTYKLKDYEIGQYKNGKKEGLWTENFYLLNIMKETRYKNGNITSELFYALDSKELFSGKIAFKYPTGIIKAELKIKDGLKHGKASFYYLNGNIKKEIKYKVGVVENVKHF